MDPSMISRMTWQEKLFLNKFVRHKCKEFHKSGYLTVNEEDLWCYLQDYRWKHTSKLTFSEKKKEIDEILFNDYFDYQRIQAQTKAPQEFDWDDMTDILY